MKMFVQLAVGDTIKPKMMIIDTKIRYWKYAKECSPVGAGMLPNAALKIVEISMLPYEMWLRAEIDGSNGSKHLRITAQEFAMNFMWAP